MENEATPSSSGEILKTAQKLLLPRKRAFKRSDGRHPVNLPRQIRDTHCFYPDRRERRTYHFWMGTDGKVQRKTISWTNRRRTKSPTEFRVKPYAQCPCRECRLKSKRRYLCCVDCGKPKINSKQKRYARCRSCAMRITGRGRRRRLEGE